MNNNDTKVSLIPTQPQYSKVLNALNSAGNPNGLTNALTGLTQRQIWSMKNLCNFDKYNPNYINGPIPCPLFMGCDELLHLGAGSVMNINFQVNTNWYTNLIGLAGS